VWLPTKVERDSTGEALPPMKQVSLGSWHCGAISTDGRVYTWGRGEWGNLGIGRRVKVALSPTLVGGELEERKVRYIHCNSGQINPLVGPGKDGLHTVAVTERGEVFSWGTGFKGQLGNLWKKWTGALKGKADELLPYRIGGPMRDMATPAPSDTKPRLDDDGDELPMRQSAKDSKYLFGEPILKALAGTSHSAVLSAGGRVYCMGDGDDGRLGLHGYLKGAPGSGNAQVNKFYVSSPSLVEELWECGVHVKDIATSRRHMVAIAL